MAGKKRIAILGGGGSSLIAAWKLVESDPDAYEITVHQVGWRLGGKGASGRRMSSPNTDHRIEEHGLHFMFGFYTNVFDVVTRAYAATYPDTPDMWQRFFKSADTTISIINIFDPPATPPWESWTMPNPQGQGGSFTGAGGGGSDGGVVQILHDIWTWIETWAKRAAFAHQPLPGPPPFSKPFPPAPPSALTLLGKDRFKIDHMDSPPVGASPALLQLAKIQPYWEVGQDFVRDLAAAPPAAIEPQDGKRHAALVDNSFRVIDELFRTANGAGAAEAKLKWAAIKTIFELVVAIAKGIGEDLLIVPGSNWFTLDANDFKDWIQLHGGDPGSPAVRGLYDAVYSSYKPLAAGSILQACLKAAFQFDVGFMFKMQAGMGDTIFTPLYKALLAKNVKFEFFHRIEEIIPSADGTRIDEIRYEQQVTLKDPNTPYDPLVRLAVDVGGPIALDCWPSEPKWDLILEPDVGLDLENYWNPAASELQSLTYGAEGQNGFDAVILGISVAALPGICPQLLAADPKFSAHVNALVGSTTATQSMELWLTKTPVQPSPVVVPYTEPYDTVADMTHLIPAEGWTDAKPAALVYLTSALQEDDTKPLPGRGDTDYPQQILAAATANAETWLTRDAPALWTNLYPDGTFDWNSLFDSASRTGSDRLESQAISTPVNLSDRYVIPAPGSFQKRLKSNETQFLNLYITGDWIKTSLSIGCFEATAMSGVQAARAVSLELGTTKVLRAVNDWIEDVTPR